mgnify:CR=1 FL=1
MKKCVDEGNLGAKTGTGLYQWKPEELDHIKKTREEVLIEWLKKDKAVRNSDRYLYTFVLLREQGLLQVR